MRSRRILLLGASGFLGSSLKNYLEENFGLEIIAPSRGELTASTADQLAARVLEIRSNTEAGLVLNCIAETSLRNCEVDPVASELVNKRLPIKLSRYLPDSVHLIHFSTDAVYAGDSAPYQTDDKPSPKTAYGTQKAAADEEMLKTRNNLSVIRGSFFGPSRNGRPGILNFFLENMRAGKSVEGYSDYVNNMVSTSTIGMVVARAIDGGQQGLLHIGSRESISKYEFGKLVAESFGFSVNLVQPTLSPQGSLAFGGANLTLESSSSWAKLELKPPGILDQLEGLRHGTEGIT